MVARHGEDLLGALAAVAPGTALRDGLDRILQAHMGALVVVAALKGRFLLATIGVFIWVFAWIGAIRLGKPKSIWARWRYKPGSGKRRRAEERDARYQARWVPRKDRLLDLIGGSPSDPERR